MLGTMLHTYTLDEHKTKAPKINEKKVRGQIFIGLNFIQYLLKKLISLIILTPLCEKFTFIFHISSFLELLGENDLSGKKKPKFKFGANVKKISYSCSMSTKLIRFAQKKLQSKDTVLMFELQDTLCHGKCIFQLRVS